MEMLRLDTVALFQKFRAGLRQTAKNPGVYDVWDRLID